MHADPTVRPMLPEDWPTVRRIYVEGLAGGNASFEREAPAWEDWDTGHLAAPRLVATLDGRVAGWAALAAYSDRCVYGGVAEVSIYVDGADRGRGLGRTLLEALISGSEDAGIWTLQAGVFPENAASVALHERCGFRRVGVRERIGKLEGRWRDVLLLERRSARVGAA